MKCAIKFISDYNDLLLVVSKNFQEFIIYGNSEKKALEYAKMHFIPVIKRIFPRAHPFWILPILLLKYLRW